MSAKKCLFKQVLSILVSSGLLAVFLLATAQAGELVFLVKDINPGSGDSVDFGFSFENDSNLTTVNNKLFFEADDGNSGRELWQSDGTVTGTILVKDINPGPDSSFPKSLTAVNGVLFFAADDGNSEGSLWKSDGTEAGTVLVKKEIGPQFLTNVNGVLFFRATDSRSTELWKSDGTEAGTVLVKDINPGHGSGSYPQYLTNVNGILFFSTIDHRGSELWKSDGTEAGTVLVKDININSGVLGNSFPELLMNVNGALFFTADDGISGRELWKSDGTEAGTVLVKDINPGDGSSFSAALVDLDFLSLLTNVNGTLFFRADDGNTGQELWKSDGTEAGTVQVLDIGSGNAGLSPSYLTNVNGLLFFSAGELWKSDGTAAGTVLAKDITPGISSFPEFLTVVDNNKVFFSANDGSTGRELWLLIVENNVFLPLIIKSGANGS